MSSSGFSPLTSSLWCRCSSKRSIRTGEWGDHEPNWSRDRAREHQQADVWNGREGEHWAEHTRRYDRASRRHASACSKPPPQPDRRRPRRRMRHRLDTRDAARRATQVRVRRRPVAAMLDQAREQSRTEAFPTSRSCRQTHRSTHSRNTAYDVAISSFGAMFFADPIAAFANVGRAPASRSRLTLSVWRELARTNGSRSCGRPGGRAPTPRAAPRVPSPFTLGRSHRVRSDPERSRFTGIDFEPIDEPIDFGSDPTTPSRSFRRSASSRASPMTSTTTPGPRRSPSCADRGRPRHHRRSAVRHFGMAGHSAPPVNEESRSGAGGSG